MLTQPKILVISTDKGELAVIEDVLGEHLVLQTASDLLEVETFLAKGDCAAALCGWSFHQGDRRAALDRIRQRCPHVPVVIFCGQEAGKELIEAVERGSLNLLAAPNGAKTVHQTPNQPLDFNPSRTFRRVTARLTGSAIHKGERWDFCASTQGGQAPGAMSRGSISVVWIAERDLLGNGPMTSRSSRQN